MVSPRHSSARHRADVRPSTPLDPMVASAQNLGRKTVVVVATSGLAAAGATSAMAADVAGPDASGLTAQARAVMGAQSLASVPVAAAWTLDIPALTVIAAPAPAEEAAEAPEAAADAPPPADPPAEATEPAAPEKTDKADKADKPAKADKKADKADKADDKAEKAEKPSPQAAAAAKADELGSAVLEVATRYVGVPYLYGGNTPGGFDCSGFTQYVFGQLGVDLPHQSESQRSKGRVVSREDAKPGDLIWVPGHVSIFVGGNKMIDSARAGTTVQFRTMWQSNPTFIRLVG